MFNPLSVIIKDNESMLEEDKSIKDVYHDNVKGIADAVNDTHKDLVKFTKRLIWDIKKDKPVKVTASKIALYKFDKFAHSVFSILTNSCDSNAMYLLQYAKRIDHQVYLLKKIFDKPSNKLLTEMDYYCKGIGFKTIELPTMQEYMDAIYPYKDIFKKDTLLLQDTIINQLEKCYRSESALQDEMYKNVKWYFKENTPYEAIKYVKIFEEMNKALGNLLQDQKEKYGRIQKLLRNFHDQCTENYTDYIREIQKEEITEDNQKRLELSTKNYSTLSNSLIRLIDMVTVYHRIQTKIILMSYENYKEIIQIIFDSVKDRV